MFTQIMLKKMAKMCYRSHSIWKFSLLKTFIKLYISALLHFTKYIYIIIIIIISLNIKFLNNI